MVNAATINYFMDDLKLMEHFETLKKFLLMEDGEFSLSLTQQLFEKVSEFVIIERYQTLPARFGYLVDATYICFLTGFVWRYPSATLLYLHSQLYYGSRHSVFSLCQSF